MDKKFRVNLWRDISQHLLCDVFLYYPRHYRVLHLFRLRSPSRGYRLRFIYVILHSPVVITVEDFLFCSAMESQKRNRLRANLTHTQPHTHVHVHRTPLAISPPCTPQWTSPLCICRGTRCQITLRPRGKKTWNQDLDTERNGV